MLDIIDTKLIISEQSQIDEFIKITNITSLKKNCDGVCDLDNVK